MPDLGGLMDHLQRMQVTQSAEYVGQAGGGVVKITATGGFDFRSVVISPDAVDPDDVDMLQDLVVAALHDLVAKVNAAAQDAVAGLGGMPGMQGLPGMPGMPAMPGAPGLPGSPTTSGGPVPAAAEDEPGDEPEA
ncbi:MAG: YbaB/EbfC family nucleoid-associated protein [Acidimicrobiales bacterium]